MMQTAGEILTDDELAIRLSEIIQEIHKLDDNVSDACDYYHAYIDMSIIALEKSIEHIGG